MKFLRVLVEQAAVRLNDSDDLDIGAMESAACRYERATVQKTGKVIVDQTNNGNAQRSGRGRLGGEGDESEGEECGW